MQKFAILGPHWPIELVKVSNEEYVSVKSPMRMGKCVEWVIWVCLIVC